MSLTARFQAAIRSAGLTPPESILADGKLHRFASNGKGDDDAGWYVLHLDGLPAGAFGCWRTGAKHDWRAEPGRKLTPGEEAAYRKRLEVMRRTREAAEVQRKASARNRAEAIWSKSETANGHDYLAAKGVKSYGLRAHDGALAVPIRDSDGELQSLQLIDGAGEKKFLPGSRVGGCYFSIGKPNAVLCVSEGYATGASVFEATGHAVAVAFNAGNLVPVAKALRAKFPQARIILAGDNDASQVGQRAAREAAQAVDGEFAIPAEPGKDWNDVHRSRGVEAVRAGIEGASVATVTNECSVVLLRGSDATPEPIRWLWREWLARGKFHIVAGAPGTGKTTLALALAATVTTGGRWPDGTRSDIGSVLMWSGEDGVRDTLLPRLLAMGADHTRLYFVTGVLADGQTRAFDPARDMQALARKAADIGDVRLMIVDPIVNVVSGDSHKNSETRRSLQPVVDLAAKLDAAALGVSHFSKGTSGHDPIERVTGSLAFGALPRIVFGTAKKTDEHGNTERLFVRAKSNIGPDGGGYGYGLQQQSVPKVKGLTASCVLWGSALHGEARELLATAEIEERRGERSATDEAEEWLKSELKDGPMKASNVQREAKEAGITEKALRSARERLKIKPEKEKGDMKGGWKWKLPAAEDAQIAEDAQVALSQKLGIFGVGGHLREPETANSGDSEGEV